jgi:hypothetical protein
MQRLIVNATFTVGVVVLVLTHMASAEEKAPGESFRDRPVNFGSGGVAAKRRALTSAGVCTIV